MNKKNWITVRAAVVGTILGILLSAFVICALLACIGTRWFWVLLWLALLICVCMAFGYFYVAKPYFETTRKLGAFAARLALEDLQDLRYPYNRQMEALTLHLKAYMETSTSLELSKRQAQYLALQNQINPHFLYNTLESIRSEVLIAGLDSVAEMCEALATFFRYTISNTQSLVMLEDEIQNIQTYFYIQQYRFGSRLHLDIAYDEQDREEILRCMIPKLTLQPIVENAIIHGIEQKMGDGTVSIRLLLTEQRLVINVMDNGAGIDRETLEQINRHMVNRSVVSKGEGGIAIANVNNRIKLMFGEAYGVTVFSTVQVGTDVEITLPITVEGGAVGQIKEEAE